MTQRRASRRCRFDERWRRRVGARLVAGVDEVGRGCLAGPVVVAAVVLPDGLDLPGVRDSKKLSPRARELAYQKVRENCLGFAARAISASEVDRLNVLAASLLGMSIVVQQLEQRSGISVDHVLVDGHQLPRDIASISTPLVKGDDRSLSIAAASIVAKVLRDRLMRSWAKRYPEFGFDRHVGYPTPEHLAALKQVGPCVLHRRTFAPVTAAYARLSAAQKSASELA